MNSSTRPYAHRLPRVLWLLVWICLAIYLGFTVWVALAGLVYPYQLDYGEGIVLWFAQQIAHGHSIYKGLAELPYASSNYPPVSMFLAALLMPIFGEGYAGGRLLNFASALIVAALIYRIVRVEAGKRWLGALAALFFLGSPYIYHWIPLFRADLLGLAFAFGGVFCIWEFGRKSQVTSHRSQVAGRNRPTTGYWLLITDYVRSTERRLLITGCLSFLLALYTKQTLFAAPAAAFLALFQYNRRLAITFALALGASGGAIYLAIDAATSGAFTFGLITSNATVFLPDQLFNLLANFAITFPILIMLALWRLANRVRARQVGVLEWYAVVSGAALVLAGRMGAWENYFFEVIVVLCVLAGFAIRDTGYGIRHTRVVIPLLLLVQLALIWHDPRIAVDLMAEGLPANRQLAVLLARTPGTIVSEDMGALATSGKNVDYYTFQYSSLARSGQWDQSWELNSLRDGAFSLVILEHGTREDVDHYRRFTREFVSALDRYYARVQTIGKYEVYAPAPLARLQSAEFGEEIAMVGWSAEPITFERAKLRVTIVWQAKRVMTRRYTAFAHLENATGAKVAQDDHEPRWEDYPTTRWAAGEMVREDYTLNLPEDLASGKYILRVGWYETDTGDRLAVPGSVDDSAVLMTLQK